MSSTATKSTLAITLVAGIALLIILLRPPPAQPPAAADAPAPPAARPAATTAPGAAPDATAQLREMNARLAGEINARQRAEAEVAALRAKVAPLESNVVISLGKIEDIGKRAGAFFPALAELQALAGRDPATLNPAEKRRLLDLQRDQAILMGALPEITGFQDHPEDYGRFFCSMLQEAAGLTDAQGGQVETYMRERATEMNKLGLNSAKEPTDAALEEVWEEKRDAFNAQTADGLKKILPPGAVEKVGFGPEMMEWLEMDFDKAQPAAPARKAP